MQLLKIKGLFGHYPLISSFIPGVFSGLAVGIIMLTGLKLNSINWICFIWLLLCFVWIFVPYKIGKCLVVSPDGVGEDSYRLDYATGLWGSLTVGFILSFKESGILVAIIASFMCIMVFILSSCIKRKNNPK